MAKVEELRKVWNRRPFVDPPEAIEDTIRACAGVCEELAKTMEFDPDGAQECARLILSVLPEPKGEQCYICGATDKADKRNVLSTVPFCDTPKKVRCVSRWHSKKARP